MLPSKSLHSASIPSWVLLPMRLFLGITFVYAGIQKFTDPQFFNPNTPGYIGRQITGFALNSPLRSFLLLVEPHAILFGHLTAYGEIAIGLGTLFGLLFRPAAFFGMLLSIMFFLSATWRVYPYFYGADIVFTFCWLTMLLNGPLHTGLPTIDEWLTVGILQELPIERQQQVRPVFALVLGTTDTMAAEAMPQKQNLQPPQQQRRRYSVIQQARNERRMFIQGMLTGGGSILGLVAVGYILSRLFSSTDTTSYTGTPGSSTGATDTGSSPSSTGSSSATTGTPGTGQSSSAIAQASAVPTNSAVSFTIPSNNDPGVLIHLSSGQFVAYDALCTHAGCQVDYDPSSHLLLCPCHGAAFDPSKNAAVVNPPAPTSLQPVAIHVDSATGAITLA